MSEQDKQQPADEAEINDGARPEADAGQEASGQQDGGVEAELAETRDRLARVEKALAEADLRSQAEIQNVRRRAERDVESAHKFALEKFAADVLTVADSLERGLATLDPEDEALKPAREGWNSPSRCCSMCSPSTTSSRSTRRASPSIRSTTRR